MLAVINSVLKTSFHFVKQAISWNRHYNNSCISFDRSLLRINTCVIYIPGVSSTIISSLRSQINARYTSWRGGTFINVYTNICVVGIFKCLVRCYECSLGARPFCSAYWKQSQHGTRHAGCPTWSDWHCGTKESSLQDQLGNWHAPKTLKVVRVSPHECFMKQKGLLLRQCQVNTFLKETHAQACIQGNMV